MLVDSTSLQLTALLDFDFAYIGGPLDDLATSFMEFEANLPGPAAASKDRSCAVRRSAILSGRWEHKPVDSGTERLATDDTAALYTTLQEAGVVMPQDTRAAAIVSSLLELPEIIMPPVLCNPVMAAGRKGQQRLRDREEAERDLRSVVEELRKELSLYERMSSDASSARCESIMVAIDRCMRSRGLLKARNLLSFVNICYDATPKRRAPTADFLFLAREH